MTAHPLFFFFFFNDTATTEIYTLSLHDALPICGHGRIASGWTRRSTAREIVQPPISDIRWRPVRAAFLLNACRSEEHTSELQSRLHLVCRLLLEKKKKKRRKVKKHQSSTRSHVQ